MADRFFFCHLQKTGGMSLIRRLTRHFGEAAVYPNRGDGSFEHSVISITQLTERWTQRGAAVRLVAGHFPVCTPEILGARFTIFTLLREPVARTLSYLRHYRQLTPSVRHLTLQEIYEQDRFRIDGLVHNHMVKMLSLAPEEMTDGALTRVTFNAERLTRAKRNLAALDAIGLHERFDDFCGDLARRFGLRLGPPAFVNRTEPLAVSPAFRAQIARDNQFDVELYEYARDLVAPGAGRPAAHRGAGDAVRLRPATPAD